MKNPAPTDGGLVEDLLLRWGEPVVVEFRVGDGFRWVLGSPDSLWRKQSVSEQCAQRGRAANA